MSKSNWSEEILNRLNIRDTFESQDNKYFIAFQRLSQQLEIQKLQQQQSQQVQYESSPSPSLTSPNLKQEDLDRGIILKENQQLKNENNDLISSLNTATINNEKLEQRIKHDSLTIKSLERSNTKLQNKIENLLLEIKEKNKTIELINDEVLMNQIQYNVLKDKVKSLEKENLKLKS
ncbi:ATG16 [[Candida] subhashii]|uniref:ATG16 n=1 Tax=[Candida] subhashii TaxID=561895 RepID=A0A8J5QLZ4_9ASCO|nr:ATG16 [[Candida] subhashii]KAG7664558.1 ATG16 [[Candida] subhashii]